MSKEIFDFRKEIDQYGTLYRNDREGIDGDGVENDYTDDYGVLLAKIMDNKASNKDVVIASIRSLLGYNNIDYISNDEIESTAEEILGNVSILPDAPWIKNKL